MKRILILSTVFALSSLGGSGFAATSPQGPEDRTSPARAEQADAAIARVGAWTAQTSGTSRELRCVHFATETEGWAVGENATVLHTQDGGAIWSGVTVPGVDPSTGFNAVHMLGGNTIWVAGRSVLARSTNGGSSWVSAPLPTTVLSASNVTFSQIFPVSAEAVWAAGRGEAGGDSVGPVVLFFMSPTGVLDPDFSSYFGGSGDSQILDLYFLAINNGWMVQANGDVVRFEPVGSTSINLVFQTTPTTEPLNGIFMRDSSTGWIVGNSGHIFMTTNGGSRWSAQTSGTTRHLRAVHFYDANVGFAVGDGGTILATTDAGATWVPESGGGDVNLRAVFAVSANKAYAVGVDGTILVRSVAEPDFSLSFASETVTVQRGTSVQDTLNVVRVGGFTGKVTVTAPTATGVGIKVKPKKASTKGSSLQFTFKALASATTGTHTLTFTGNDKSGRQRTTTIDVEVE